MRAQTLPEIIRFFDPMHPLEKQELKDWYIDRPGNPLEEMKIYLQGLGLVNPPQPVKILFTGQSRDDYPVLYERHLDKQLSGDDSVLSLLQTRALLEYANGEPWCDVHPIALPLVLERAPQAKEA